LPLSLRRSGRRLAAWIMTRRAEPQATRRAASGKDSALPDSQACFHCQYSAMFRYLRPVDQSSSFSISTAPINLTAESSFGNILITRSRLRISSLSLSAQLVVRSLLRRHSGRTITAIASSKPSSSLSIALGARSPKSARSR